MEAMIEQGGFLETADVHGNLYGTSVAELARVQSSGKICILDLDTVGVRSIQAHEANCRPQDALRPFYLFLAPPSIEHLRERLQARGTETDEQIERRVSNAAAEVEFGASDDSGFDFTLVNEDLDVTVESLVSILRTIYPHLPQGEGEGDLEGGAPHELELEPEDEPRGLGLAGMAARRLLEIWQGNGAATRAATGAGTRKGAKEELVK
mmetsp:Transcript_75351/g.214292  ORF Transcript_75351/g.214292 Transcript_75351/m.214292 type:complete len:209 (+) Transcript_75351:832-1458(+)